MGVAGSGKSTLAAGLAQELGATLVEGDDHHPPANRDKMRDGIALQDSDRAPWLDRLGALLAAPGNVVLTCSALKRSYRERLRAAEPALRIVYLEITLAEAHCRVVARPGHYFPADLVASQFAALEVPEGEHGVLRVPANDPMASQIGNILDWLRRGTTRQAIA
ncbi:MAG TPA: gluconokinase [Ramlibacter sp.]|nr:gluconokinase [Ramlibacter sp.]